MKYRNIQEFAEPEASADAGVKRDRAKVVSAIRKIIKKHADGGHVEGEHLGAYMFRYNGRYEGDVKEALAEKFPMNYKGLHHTTHHIVHHRDGKGGESRITVHNKLRGYKPD